MSPQHSPYGGGQCVYFSESVLPDITVSEEKEPSSKHSAKSRYNNFSCQKIVSHQNRCEKKLEIPEVSGIEPRGGTKFGGMYLKNGD